ncbi:hybrid sensor histidine kinase/response regulator [Laspinema olomoucense]|uniref:hybrid sensor histidine kinase/response regulator n=1 Tax=Laspinema olomoucense TaxID=3231600 RepID=UPI0021BAE540|nr:hybrid sensor histidine kinase/response regulator [Laspinema sp. D3d]MCT7974547.1 hybrid sensor histidine kinase/response regulator [Laspinema sp. D3d]
MSSLMDFNDIQELLGAFIAETDEFLQSLETQLLAMEQIETAEARKSTIKEMFRAAHSIKGSALMFGFQSLSTAAHRIEDCFAILRDRPEDTPLSSRSITQLLQGVDLLKKLTAQSTALVREKQEENPKDFQADLEAIARIKQELETECGELKHPADWMQKHPANTGVIQSIFKQDLPPIFNRLETELSQLQEETAEDSCRVFNEIYYQLSGLAGMLEVPELGEIAEALRTAVDTPNVSVEDLKKLGWIIAQNLETVREQVLQELPIVLQPMELPPPHRDVAISPVPSPPPLRPSDPPPSATPPDPSLLPTASPGESGVKPTIRVELDRLTELVDLVGELVISRTHLEVQETQLRGEVKRLRRHIRDLNQFGVQLREEYDRLAGEKSHQGRSPAHPLGFDALEMDHYTEFHDTARETIETTQAIAHSSAKIDEVALNLDRSTDRLRRICDRLRSQVMQLRVVSFSRAVDHLPRAIRDMSRTYDKDVNLLLIGRDTKIDESLLHALRDPLVHLVRNAFDHGIESPEDRKAAGKPPNGQIEIEARHQGGQTIITISDDGQGIDPETIRSRLVELNLVSEEQALELSLNELYDFLFWAGFSTKREVSDLSGRGVGLDIVRSNLRQVRGTVKVDSRIGRGTTFIIKLPLMLSISDALLVRIEHHTLALPLDAVEEILHVNGSEIQMAMHQPMLRWRDEYIRLVPLNHLLHYNESSRDVPSPIPVGEDYMPVLVLSSSEGILAIVVDRLVGQQELVVKPLPQPLSKPTGILGCTILGDGEVVSILDVDDLIGQLHPHVQKAVVIQTDSPGRNTLLPPGIRSPVPLLPPLPSQPQILVIDDSYTIRQMLSLTLTRARYRVAQAKDGQDALEQLHHGLKCALIIADIEMPRMDGFEFLAAVKENPQFSPIPVAMLTSRSGAKHRQRAMDLGAVKYFTKPYNERQLLEAIAQLLGAT